MYANWVKETTTTAGTGNIGTVAIPGWRRFFDVFAANDVVYYTIQDGNNRETGIGTLGGTPNTMTRTTVLEKYEGGVTTVNPSVGINLSGNVASVYIDVPRQATFNFNVGPAIASAATTDVWNVKGGDIMDISGSATITSFGVPPKSGLVRIVRFVGTPTIMFGANIVFPGSGGPTGAFVATVQDTALLYSYNGVTLMLISSASSLTPDLPLAGGTMQGSVNFNNNSINGLNGVGWNSEYDNGNSGSAITINWANGQCQKVTLNAATPVITVNDPSVVGHYQLKIVQDTTGGRNPSFAGGAYGGVRWIGSAGPPSMNTVSKAITFVNFYYDGSLFYQAASAVNHT